jgi:hypothetical protein
MTVTIKDGLHTFGSNQIVEVPPVLPVAASGDIASTNHSTQKAPLGILYRHKGNVYRYVSFNNGPDDMPAAAGGVCHWRDLDPVNGKFTVTSDYTDAGGSGLQGKNLVAGILLNVVTDLYYTWIQVGGVHKLVKVNTSTVAGDVMIYDTSTLTFGRCAVDAAVTGLPFGVALDVDSPSGFAPVLLLNMIW